MKSVSAFCVVLVSLTGCTPAETPRQAVARVGAEALVQDAWATQRSVVQASLPSRTPVDYEARIDPAHWGPAIRALRPKYVYFHRVNVVAILSTTEDTETGLYIYLPISSFILDPAESKAWSATPIADSIHAVTRKGIHGKGVQGFR